MAEKSIFWTTGTSGDGTSGLTESDARKLFWSLSGKKTSQGVILGYLNALAATGATSPVAINTGAAMVAGLFYWNDASVNVSVPTPSVGTTGHRIVLRADWSTRTVRITRIDGTDGAASLPAITQSEGSIFDLPLCSLMITTGGAITLTDERLYYQIPGLVATGRIDAQALDHNSAGERLLRVSARQGGSSTVWATPGTSNYIPPGVRVKMQAGARQWSGASASSGTVAVTFPDSMTYAPGVLVSCQSELGRIMVWATSVSTTGFTINWADWGANTFTSLNFSWLAIGAV